MSSEMLVRWLETWSQLNIGAALVLATIFVVAAFVPVPRTILVLGAGAAFGLKALLVIVPSTTLGCVLAFILARGLLRTRVQRQIDRRPAWHVVAQAIDAEGWRIVALMRFGGPLPNSAQNFLFGMTNIRLAPYALITLVFTLPQIVLYTYLGASGRSILFAEGELLSLNRIVVAVAAAVMLVIFVLVARRVRAILAHNSPAPVRN